jgi:hypothetical protein
MLSLAEIGPALYGAWRLAHFDADGMRYFDRSIAGFWRSFRVALLAAPLWIIILGVNLAPMHIGGSWIRLVTAETIGYVIAWVAYPLAAFYLTRLIDRQKEYVGFIVALNWSTLIQLAIMTPAHVIAATGLLSFDFNLILVLGAELAYLVYEWFITRTALRLSGLGAVGFVVVDFVIGNLVNQISAMEAYAS